MLDSTLSNSRIGVPLMFSSKITQRDRHDFSSLCIFVIFVSLICSDSRTVKLYADELIWLIIEYIYERARRRVTSTFWLAYAYLLTISQRKHLRTDFILDLSCCQLPSEMCDYNHSSSTHPDLVTDLMPLTLSPLSLIFLSFLMRSYYIWRLNNSTTLRKWIHKKA